MSVCVRVCVCVCEREREREREMRTVHKQMTSTEVAEETETVKRLGAKLTEDRLQFQE